MCERWFSIHSNQNNNHTLHDQVRSVFMITLGSGDNDRGNIMHSNGSENRNGAVVMFQTSFSLKWRASTPWVKREVVRRQQGSCWQQVRRAWCTAQTQQENTHIYIYVQVITNTYNVTSDGKMRMQVKIKSVRHKQEETTYSKLVAHMNGVNFLAAAATGADLHVFTLLIIQLMNEHNSI